MDLKEIQDAIEALSGDQQRALSRWLRRKRGREPGGPDQRVFFRSPALLWTVASLLAFLIVEGAVFRLGWYNKYLEPNSSAGMVESYLFWLSRGRPVKVPEVMVIGDSRIAEGFSAPAAEKASEGRVHYWNFGIGGSSPRIWYYMLRDADPTRRRFAAIAFPMDRYADEDRWDSEVNRLIDLNFVIGRLRLTDCWDFASSMQSTDFKVRAFGGCVFKGIPLRRDVQELLLNMRDRVKRAKDWRNNGVIYINDYGGRPESLEGLSADWVHRRISFPPGLDQFTKDTIRDWLMPPPPPQRGDTLRYRQVWFNRILDLYKDSPTKMVFFELPRAPLPKPESKLPAAWLQSALKRPRVEALPQNTFRDLERPEIYVDGLHLNKVGRGLFSERMTAKILPLIGIR